MVRTCICCKYRVNKHKLDISLFGFPKDNELLKKWLSAIGTEKKVSESSRICSRHFKEDDFRYSLVGGNRFLKRGVIPSLHLNGKIINNQSSDSQDAISEENQSMDIMDEHIMGVAENEILSNAVSQAEAESDNQLHIIERKKEESTNDTCENTKFQSHKCHSKSQVPESKLLLSSPSQKRLESKHKKFLYDVRWEEISTSPVQAKIYWEVAIGKISRQKVVMKTLRQRVKRLKGKIQELRLLVKNTTSGNS